MPLSGKNSSNIQYKCIPDMSDVKRCFAHYTHINPCHSLIASSKLKPDMVLEDVDSDNEGQQKLEDNPKAAALTTTLLTPPSPSTQQQHEATQQTQSNSLLVLSTQSQTCGNANPEPSECVTKISQEDAETQTGRWTPFIESIKREAEDVALATMEER